MATFGKLPGAGMWGWIDVGELSPLAAPPSPDQACAQKPILRRRLAWQPGPLLRPGLSGGFNLEFDESVSSGARRIAPCGGAGTFLLPAALAGHELLKQSGRLESEGSISYDAMRLIVQLADRVRENLQDLRFRRAIDLHISQPARTILGESNILPSDLLATWAESAEAVTVAEFNCQGRAAASELQIQDPDEETIIRLGLREYAKRNPLNVGDLSAEDAARIVRLSIFDVGPADGPVSSAVREMIHRRIQRAIANHLDDSTSEFEQWFHCGLDGVVHQISKAKKDGGLIDRKVVRQALLDDIIDSFRYVGKCVSAIMTEIADSLMNPLSPDDRAVFDAMYLGQPWLGFMPIVVLWKQFDLVREICLEILANPTNAELQGQLLRVLQWHGTMVNKRRAADRVQASSSDSKTLAGRGASETATDELDKRHASKTLDMFQKIAVEFRDQRQAKCQCGCLDNWWVSNASEVSECGVLRWEDECGECGHRERVEVPLGAFKQRMDAVDEDPTSPEELLSRRYRRRSRPVDSDD